MTRPTDIAQIHVDVHDLLHAGGLLDRLEQLLPETASSTGPSGPTVAGSRPPWHPEAAAALYDIHAGAREVEDNLRAALGFARTYAGRYRTVVIPFRPTYRVGDPAHRGSSADNTRRALQAIPDLATAAGDPHAAHAARAVSAWVRTARTVRDVDLADPWVPLPKLPGQRPPPCPWCGTWALRMNLRLAEVRCFNSTCHDEHDAPRIGWFRDGGSGRSIVEFTDGTQLPIITIDPQREQANHG